MTGPAQGQNRAPTGRGRVRGWLLNLLLILLVLGGVQWWKSRPMASGEAPPLTAMTLSGRPLDLADLRGQPVLVHFWATWCPVCRLGNGAIDAIARDHRVVTVALQSGDPAEIREYMATEGLSFEVLPDPTGAVASQWGVPGVPATFILDPAGRIAFSTPGISSEWGLRARLWAADLID
jgi:peroxiredoxin